jgi:peroxiredoxin
MMMRIYKREAKKLAEHGVKLVAISPSAGSDAEDFARIIGVDYLLLADPDCRAAQMFGAIAPKAFKGQDMPLPASFLVDPQGVLRFASVPQNVQAFLDPGLVIDILEQRKAAQPVTA